MRKTIWFRFFKEASTTDCISVTKEAAFELKIIIDGLLDDQLPNRESILNYLASKFDEMNEDVLGFIKETRFYLRDCFDDEVDLKQLYQVIILSLVLSLRVRVKQDMIIPFDVIFIPWLTTDIEIGGLIAVTKRCLDESEVEMTEAFTHTVLAPLAIMEANIEKSISCAKVINILYNVIVHKEAEILASHSQRVASIGEWIGNHVLRWPKFKVEILKNGCLLHDIGLLKMDNDQIKKEQSLDDEGTKVKYQHPKFGYEILEGLKPLKIPGADIIANCARYHYEREDGTGQNKIPGGKLETEVKVVIWADSFDKIISQPPNVDGERLRRKGGGKIVSLEDVFNEIISQNGEKFDSQLTKSILTNKSTLRSHLSENAGIFSSAYSWLRY